MLKLCIVLHPTWPADFWQKLLEGECLEWFLDAYSIVELNECNLHRRWYRRFIFVVCRNIYLNHKVRFCFLCYATCFYLDCNDLGIIWKKTMQRKKHSDVFFHWQWKFAMWCCWCYLAVFMCVAFSWWLSENKQFIFHRKSLPSSGY